MSSDQRETLQTCLTGPDQKSSKHRLQRSRITFRAGRARCGGRAVNEEGIRPQRDSTTVAHCSPKARSRREHPDKMWVSLAYLDADFLVAAYDRTASSAKTTARMRYATLCCCLHTTANTTVATNHKNGATLVRMGRNSSISSATVFVALRQRHVVTEFTFH